MKVYKAICDVSRELCAAGIGKDRKASSGGASYAFRGIDDVLQVLAPLLPKHGLCMLPRVTSRQVVERTTKGGSVMIYVCLTVEYDLVSAEDGSKHTICTMGEAFDSGDKATNKAMSAAYKYAAIEAFCIPVEGVAVDSERDNHDFGSAPLSIADGPGAVGYPVPRRAPPPPIMAQVVASAPKPVDVDALKQRIVDASTPALRKAVRAEIAAYHGEGRADLERLYNMACAPPKGTKAVSDDQELAF